MRATSGPPAVAVHDVSKRFRLYHDKPTSLKERIINWRKPKFEEFWALEGVSLEVAPGETFGLIGPNGSGKSTLLKCIAGILLPDTGTIETRGRMASLLELGAGFHPDLTGRENVYLNASILGLTRQETDRYFDDIVGFAELEPFIDMQVKHYSSGMYVRLGFAVAVHVDPDVLIVDEVLAVGDEVFQRKCFDRIRRFQREGRTIVVVTHAVDQVREICSHAAFLHHGVVRTYGEADDVVRAFRETVHGEAHLETEAGGERGSGELQIVSVSVRDGAGAEREIFYPDDAMEVVVDVEAREPVRNPNIGISVHDERDQTLFGTNTGRRDLELGLVTGKVRVRFRIERLPLMDGRYGISVGVTTPDERNPYHWWDRASSFWCVNTGRDAGSIRFPTDVTVETL